MGSMLTIFRFSLWRSRWQILGWGLPLLLLGFITAPFYDLVAENEANLMKVIDSLPDFVKGFAGGDAVNEIFTPAGFLSLRYFAFLPVILGIFGVVAGSGLVAADEERGVLDFVLAHPASRAAVFFGRLLSVAVSLAAILLLGCLGIWLGVLRTESLDFSFWRLGLTYICVFGVTALFASIALAFSMFMPSRAAAAMGAGIILFASYIITSLANGIKGLEAWAAVSPITYFQNDAINGIEFGKLFGLLAVSALFIAAAWLGFRNRDIRVAGDGGWKLPWKRG